MLKFIVLSDLHLVPQGELSHSIETMARLERALEMIAARHSDADFLVLNGDLADHGDIGAYERLKSAMEQVRLPAYYTLGNHDNAANFATVFGAQHAVFDHVIEAGDQRVIVLNSQHEGHVAGKLEPEQLEWLSQALDAASGLPVTVVLHHPVFKLGIGTDFIRLANEEALLTRLAAHGNVRQVISGHVHCSTTALVHGIPCSTVAGNHYNFDAFSAAEIGDMTRREGPGQMAVVLSDENSTVLHYEDFWTRHDAMDPKHFIWNG